MVAKKPLNENGMIALSSPLSQLQDALIYFGMPAVTCYHLLCGNAFLNTAAEDAQGLEKVGNIALSSFRYLFAGNQAHRNADGKYDIQQYFDYHENVLLKSTGALITLPFGVAVGSALKGLAFLSQEVRARHAAIVQALHATHIVPNTDYYASLLMHVYTDVTAQRIATLDLPRCPGDEQHLSEEKKAFAQIVQILTENAIPFWADCGTCLGAYRYGGIIPWDNDLDLGILQPDFGNMKRALNVLDPKLYLVEDWSSRCHPETYVRVYVRSTRQYIDIYTYAIHPETRTIQYICSNVDNMFMLEGWKINERRYMVETPFEVVFPLRTALFDGIEVPVPNQTERYLQMRYGENLSPVKIYNAETGRYEKDLTHPYWQRAHAH